VWQSNQPSQWIQCEAWLKPPVFSVSGT
jgi:hypothetical protein